jgi:hypothetical protein
MTVDVTSVFAAYLAQNRGPDPDEPTATRPSEYGVSAQWEDGVVRLALTFRRGCVYCCMESGCHLRLFSTKQWEWLRRELSARGIQLPSRLTVMVEVVVEDGAIFFDYSRPDQARRGRYAFAPVNAQRYQHVVEEAAL